MTTSTALLQQTNLDRVRYFSRQLITVDDMLAEQAYFREKLRRHNRYLHGWGVVCGCEVVAAPEKTHPWRVQICPGYVVTPMGDEIYIPPMGKIFFDFTAGPSRDYDPCEKAAPCLPANKVKTENESKTVFLAVCYTECHVRPMRIHPAGCGCDDAACEYSRVREGFEFIQLWDLPESHALAEKEDEGLYKKFQNASASGTSAVTHNYGNETKGKVFVPNCPERVDDDCVVLASITLPESKQTSLVKEDITYEKRRVLLSYPALRAVVLQSLQPTANPNPEPTVSPTPGPVPTSTPRPTPGPMPTPTPGPIQVPIIDWTLIPEPDLIPIPPVEIMVDPIPLEERISELGNEVVLNANVILNHPAPAEGVNITLSKTDSNLIAVSLPGNVMIPPGQTQVSFQIKVWTGRVATNRLNPFESKIIATLGNQSKIATLKGNMRQ